MLIIIPSIIGSFLFVVIMLSIYIVIPKKDRETDHSMPASYLIQGTNRMDIQQHNECAAFSSAYVLRHFGIEADGNEIYKNFLRKLVDGTITSKGILSFFKRQGFAVAYYRGNVESLKLRLTHGVPVIAFVRTLPNQRYLHFVPVVGYDRDSLYLADSLHYTINCNEPYFNRKITIPDFERVWKTWVPFNKYSYIVIQTKKEGNHETKTAI